MTKAQGRMQHEKGLVVIGPALPAAPTPRWSPDPERVEDFPVNLPLLGMGRIIGRQGLDMDSGRLVEFSISAQVEYQGAWSEVARVDTAHEEVHLHVRSRNGLYIARSVLCIISGPQDVDKGYEDGERLLLTNWEEHEGMWRRGTPGPGAGRGCP
jgi:hypothetical protein